MGNLADFSRKLKRCTRGTHFLPALFVLTVVWCTMGVFKTGRSSMLSQPSSSNAAVQRIRQTCPPRSLPFGSCVVRKRHVRGKEVLLWGNIPVLPGWGLWPCTQDTWLPVTSQSMKYDMLARTVYIIYTPRI
jgi:hypothetical protein